MRLDESLPHVLRQLEREKGIPVMELKEAIEASFLSAYKKKYGKKNNIVSRLSKDLIDINLYSIETVVEEPEEDGDITLEEAKEKDVNLELGSTIETLLDIDSKSFGPYATQVAKQIIYQKMRDAEKRQVYNEYHKKQGEIVTGYVQRLEKNNIIVKLGKYEAVLTHSEQVPGEKFRVGDRLRLYIADITSNAKGVPQILLSRAHAGFVQKLFELEVPEIAERTVEIKSIAREPGYRTKLAVGQTKSNIDPVGACIGNRGARIKAIVSELMGEKIDIVRWSENSEDFILNALSPAKVLSVKVTDRRKNSAHVIVPDDQLSLAIGKEGQNVRLAAKLTNFHIDIESQSQAGL